MKIVLLNGGLGNQAFQYIFGRYLELSTGESCLFDDSYFFLTEEKREQEKMGGVVTVHNGYELKKVFPNSRLNLLSEQFTEDVWHYMLNQGKQGIGIAQQLLDNGIDISIAFFEGLLKGFSGTVFQYPPNQYVPQVLEQKGDIYYYGYWVNNGWFEQYKNILLTELRFTEVQGENKKYEEEILSTDSVAVHVRRGDYINLGMDLSNRFYQQLIAAICRKPNQYVFFVFSDDIAWCKKNIRGLGLVLPNRVVFVEGNYDREHNYVDMQLMSMCKTMVLSNSSFSYLAALLNTRRDKKIYNPVQRDT